MIRLVILFLATLAAQAVSGQALPPAPALTLPEGLDGVVVIRTAKIQSMLAEMGVPADLLEKTPLNEGFNPLQDMPDEHISSAVFGVGSNQSGELCLVSFTQDKTINEVMKADGNHPGVVSGDDEYRVITEKRTYGTSTRSYRRFSPREFLLIRNVKAGAPAQPAKMLSALRAAAVKQDCLILAAVSGSAISKKLPPELAGSGDRLGVVMAGVMKLDGLRCFARVECASEPLAAQLAAFAGKLGPQKMMPPEVPETLRPKAIITSEGRLAGLEITLPKVSVGLALTAFLHGMSDNNEAVRKAKARRNAQSVASLFHAGRAAGSAELAKVNSELEVMAALTRGVTGAGQFSTSTFKLQLSKDEQEDALAWLDWDEQQDDLVYQPSP